MAARTLYTVDVLRWRTRAAAILDLPPGIFVMRWQRLASSEAEALSSTLEAARLEWPEWADLLTVAPAESPYAFQVAS